MSIFKKDGSIKIAYLPACTFLLNGIMTHHNVEQEMHCTALPCDIKDGQIIEQYDAYEIECKLPYSKQRRIMQHNVTEICHTFEIEPYFLYGLNDWSIVFKEQTKEYLVMITELRKLLNQE